MSHPPAKTCASCGRTFEWRKKWERDWDQVRHCSTACRRRGVTPVDAELAAALLRLLGTKPTVDPDDAARAVGGDDWQGLHEPAHRAARRLVAAGRVEIIQKGRVVDPSTAKGSILVRRRR